MNDTFGSHMFLSNSHSTAKIDSTLDRQAVTMLRKRFHELNASRLKRTRRELNDRQRIFLDTLPLLFHCNHPILPGYVSRDTPCNVSGYRPTKEEVERGKQLARSFCLKPSANQRDDIWAIYIMGSVGTIAHNTSSDFDIWLCIRPGMEKEDVEELEEKAHRISQWANSLRLEVHFFLMDCDDFRAGNLSNLDKESSGSAQRILLLDEFYRTGIYVAGRMPLWWFVPANQENHYSEYTEKLLSNRYIDGKEVLDFGHTATIPEGEFIGAAVWQMYKAIESPYKSVLKLLLLEAYASETPNIEPLSLTFKNQVYEGQPDINELDPYIMAYRRIEDYLQDKKQSQRLALAQRCLYYKINKPLSKTKVGHRISWQRQHLKRLVEEWGWDFNEITFLDSRSRWHVNQVKKERAQLVNALNHTYRFLYDFATRTGASRYIYITIEELNVLGRKLQAAFERRPGKIDWVNPGIADNIIEKSITILEESPVEYGSDNPEHVDDESYSLAHPHSGKIVSASPRKSWYAFSEDSNDVNSDVPVRHGPSLVDLLLWGYFNGVFDDSTRFSCESSSITITEIKRIMMTLHQWLPDIRPKLPHSVFQMASRPTSILLFINVASEQLDDGHRKFQRLSNNINAINYGADGKNLIQSIDIVLRNSWHEIGTRRLESKAALVGALSEYMSKCLPGSHNKPPELKVECVGSEHNAIITKRVTQWFGEITDCFYSGKYPSNTRYLFEMGKEYYCIEIKENKLYALNFVDDEHLIKHLGEPQKEYSKVVIDSETLKQHPLKAIVKSTRPGVVSVYLEQQERQAHITVVDESGSYMVMRCAESAKQYALSSLHMFMRSVLERMARSLDETMYDLSSHPIKFHELKREGQGGYSTSPRVVMMKSDRANTLEIKVVAESDEHGQFCYSFYCDENEFSWVEYGNRVFDHVAKFISGYRRTQEPYPVFITDLNMDQCRYQLAQDGHLQLSHYLKAKLKIEERLNLALKRLSFL